MKRILIADDHSAIRNGVKLILSNEFNDMEFGEAVNSTDVLKKTQEKKWDILILDMDMPGRNGLDVLKQLKEEKSTVPVLMFSLHQEGQIAVRALKAGAKGYLSKDAVDTELVTAVKKIMAGSKYITPGVTELLACTLTNPTDKEPHELLSDREYQILILFGKGKTVSQIAKELSLSIPTISTYRSRILDKMGLENNAELALYAINNHLI